MMGRCRRKMPNLKTFLQGDLGPARRCLKRASEGRLPLTGDDLRNMAEAIERCIRRIKRDIPDTMFPTSPEPP